jgi:hypothetical protein
VFIRGRVCIRVFIGVNVRAYCELLLCNYKKIVMPHQIPYNVVKLHKLSMILVLTSSMRHNFSDALK